MQIIRFIFFPIIALSLFSCIDHAPNEQYDLTCKIDKNAKCDSISIFILENEYNKLRMIYSGKTKNGIHHISGFSNAAKAAFIKFGNDSTPLFFILEPSRQSITINSNTIVQKGGTLNIAFNNYIKERKKLENERNANFKTYLDSVNTGGMTSSLERMHFVKDSIISQSIERITLDIINRDSLAVKPIIKQLYGI